MKSTKLIEKKRPVIGSIIEICIDDKYYTYAKKLQKERYVFFDYYSTYQIDDSKIIDRLNKLFILTIYTDTYRRPNWKVFNKIEIREDFRKLPLEFIYDKFTDRYKICDTNTGEIRKSNREEIFNSSSDPQGNFKDVYTAQWNEFSFADDGWNQDPEGNRALVVKAGSFLTINELYPLYLSNAG